MALERYREHLSDADLAALADAAGRPGSAAELAAHPERVEALLGDPAVYRALFEREGDDPLLRVTPFLAFSVLLARVEWELSRATFLEEWVGPGRRVPVFDTAGPRDLLRQRRHRLFLAELLTSYTRVASGSFWVRTRRGWRRRRYSELDPVRLAELLEVVPTSERRAVFRRLGDLALFLTGVFPDNAGSRPIPPVQLQRLLHQLGTGIDVLGPGEAGPIEVLDRLGRHAYRQGGMADVAERFAPARRALNFLADRHLFAMRERWFPG